MLLALVLTACSNSQTEEEPTETRPSMNVQDSLAMVAFYHSMKCAEWKGEFHWDLKDYETWGGVFGVLDKEKNEYRITEIHVPDASDYIHCQQNLAISQSYTHLLYMAIIAL